MMTSYPVNAKDDPQTQHEVKATASAFVTQLSNNSLMTSKTKIPKDHCRGLRHVKRKNIRTPTKFWVPQNAHDTTTDTATTKRHSKRNAPRMKRS